MAKYRNQLPQVTDTFFITTGDLETTLVYREGVELPGFALFDVLKNESRCEWMKNYLPMFVNIARKYCVGIIFVNRKGIELLDDIRNEYKNEKVLIVINERVGPRGDGYNSTVVISAEEAQAYHATQIDCISETNVDMVTAFTLNYPEEAIGIARAAKAVDMPAVISFTVETNGRLSTGQTLTITITTRAYEDGLIFSSFIVERVRDKDLLIQIDYFY